MLMLSPKLVFENVSKSPKVSINVYVLHLKTREDKEDLLISVEGDLYNSEVILGAIKKQNLLRLLLAGKKCPKN